MEFDKPHYYQEGGTMPDSSIPHSFKEAPWHTSRKEQIRVFETLVEGAHTRQMMNYPSNRGTITVSRRPNLERFLLKLGMPGSLVVMFGGTRVTPSYRLVEFARTDTPLYITGIELFVDDSGNLYDCELRFNLKEGAFLSINPRAYPVTGTQLYRDGLLGKAIEALSIADITMQ
jgi:hypothetical protein